VSGKPAQAFAVCRRRRVPKLDPGDQDRSFGPARAPGGFRRTELVTTTGQRVVPERDAVPLDEARKLTAVSDTAFGMARGQSTERDTSAIRIRLNRTL